MVKHSIFHFHIRLIINMRSSVVTLDISQSQPHLPNANDYFTLPFFFCMMCQSTKSFSRSTKIFSQNFSLDQPKYFHKIFLSIKQNIFTKVFSRSTKIFSQKFSLDQPKYFHKNFPDQPKCFPVYLFSFISICSNVTNFKY